MTATGIFLLSLWIFTIVVIITSITFDRLHWSRVIVLISWLLDYFGYHTKSDRLDFYAANKGWWHR